MDDRLKHDIKFNCDVSDARYWGYFSICGLLLRYRDLYRSEQGLKAWSDINREAIGAWIQAKEGRWPELEHAELRDIRVDGKSFPPFEVAAINRELEPRGLVYGAGYGMYMKPTFFLAELRSRREIDGLTVFASGREIVRDLFTAPAMLQGDSIFLRQEPLLILLHFKLSELNLKKNKTLETAFCRYGFTQLQLMDDTLEKRLEGMADRYAEIILAHEIAEHREGIPEWKDILAAAGDRKNEHYLRALKDLIADTAESGPLKQIIAQKDLGGLSISVALMEGFHRLLFPEISDHYAELQLSGDWTPLESLRNETYARLIRERERIVTLFRASAASEPFSTRLTASLSIP